MPIFAFQLPPQVVETILDSIIGSSWNDLGHGGPMTSNGVVEVKDGCIFHWVPIRSLEPRIQMIHVAFPTLFARSVWKTLGHHTPPHGHTHALYNFKKRGILILRPCLWTLLSRSPRVGWRWRRFMLVMMMVRMRRHAHDTTTITAGGTWQSLITRRRSVGCSWMIHVHGRRTAMMIVRRWGLIEVPSWCVVARRNAVWWRCGCLSCHGIFRPRHASWRRRIGCLFGRVMRGVRWWMTRLLWLYCLLFGRG
mmetsp:Transcript_2820/g.7910  ORF Transcript_2820/g.7910 Transcript_2820/m.7910 type:complete len:251 (+) Transcript_2820:597-1349(+)